MTRKDDQMSGDLLDAQIGRDLTDWFSDHGHSGRTTCRQAQLDLAHRDERIFSLEGDLGLPAVPFPDELPDQYRQIGIAEANLMGVAAGMAMRGIRPFVNTFATFATMRACEQMRLDIAYHASNVKVVGYYAGISGGWAGPSHHCIEDIAIMRVLPNMTILSPADAFEAYQATVAAAAHEGPVYLRLGRSDTPRVHEQGQPFEIGRAVQLRDGHDATIVATGGLMVAQALRAAELLEAHDVNCRVLNVHTLKPLDTEALTAAARETGAIVTLEDHNVIGGLGSAVASVLAERHPVTVDRFGISDRYCVRCDDYEEMLSLHGIGAQDVCDGLLRRLR